MLTGMLSIRHINFLQCAESSGEAWAGIPCLVLGTALQERCEIHWQKSRGELQNDQRSTKYDPSTKIERIVFV